MTFDFRLANSTFVLDNVANIYQVGLALFQVNPDGKK